MTSSNRKTTFVPKTLEKDPHFFGHFLNMARYNAFVILTDLYEKFDCDLSDVEENELLLQKKYKEIKKQGADFDKRFTTAIKRKFPFLFIPQIKKIADNNTKAREPMGKEVIDILNLALGTLNVLRNQYTHKYHPTKERNVFSIQHLFDYTASDKLPNRYIELKKNEASYSHLIKKAATTYRMHQSEQAYTERGLVFFICLFLEPLYAHNLFRDLRVFRDESSERRTITARCFTLNCCRLPKPKLESSDILLDMLNELGRCPKQLLNMLVV